REAAIVIEAALLVRPQAGERRGAVLVRRRALGLERVDAHLGRRVEVLPGLGVERRHVAGRALRVGLFRGYPSEPTEESDARQNGNRRSQNPFISHGEPPW